MSQFMQMPIGQRPIRKELNFNSIDQGITTWQDRVKAERENTALSQLLEQSNGNPMEAAVGAYKIGDKSLGNYLLQQKYSGDRFQQQQTATDRRHNEAMALKREALKRESAMNELKLEFQRERLKLLRNPKPDPMQALKLKKLQLEIDGMQNPENNLNGFKDKKQKLGAQGDFRKEFTKVSGDFIKVRDAQARIEASAKEPSAAGDLALIFNYMKVLDPGSTVREGEFATAQNAAGIPARLRAQWNAVLSGQRLADTQRADFVKRSRLLFGRQEQQYSKTRKIYENIARRNGLDVESVLPDFSIAEQPDKKKDNPHIKAAINPQTGERAYFDTRTGERVK